MARSARFGLAIARNPQTFARPASFHHCRGGNCLIYSETPTYMYHHHTNTSPTEVCPQKWQTQRVPLTAGRTYWRDIIGPVSWTGANKRTNASSATRRGVGSRARPATGHFGRSLVLEEFAAGREPTLTTHRARFSSAARRAARVAEFPPSFFFVAHRLRFGA